MNQPQARAHRLLLLGVSLWIGLVLLAPLAARNQRAEALFLYRFFRPVCHQLPERSFHWGSDPLAVCQRCFGLYVGFWSGLLVLRRWARLRKFLLDRPPLLLLFLLPMGLNLSVENAPWSRFLTGWMAAFPVAAFVETACEQLLRRAVALNPTRGEPHE